MTNILYENLPEEYMKDAPDIGDPKEYVQKLLKKELPRSDVQNLDHKLHWQFLLDKDGYNNKKHKPIRKKRTFLTRKERKDLNTLKLPKNGWDYNSLADLRKMWHQYMKQNLELTGPSPSCTDQNWLNFSTILARSELIGSEIKVVRSKVPTHVGINGTVVLESKTTFQIVTPQSQFKIIPKNTSVFEFTHDNVKFSVFGKHIMTKPSERSVKKIKSQMLPDL